MNEAVYRLTRASTRRSVLSRALRAQRARQAGSQVTHNVGPTVERDLTQSKNVIIM